MNLDTNAKDNIRNVVDTSLISVDIKNLGACNYATDSALYNLGGIVPSSDAQDTQQVQTPAAGVIFNFCEAPLPTPDGCPSGDFYAFITDASGCHGLKSSDSKANTVAVDMTDGQSNNITGISLLYLSDDDNYQLRVNITCDDSLGNGLPNMGFDG